MSIAPRPNVAAPANVPARLPNSRRLHLALMPTHPPLLSLGGLVAAVVGKGDPRCSRKPASLFTHLVRVSGRSPSVLWELDNRAADVGQNVAVNVAALYDIHGNLHALRAVLADVEEA